MKSVKLTAVIRRRKKRYVKSTPQITAENILNREFVADNPNEKWLTDVTEFKLTKGSKAYLSAILDISDNSIISYVIGKSNNNKLVFDTLIKLLKLIRRQRHYFIVIADFNIHLKHLSIN